MVDWDDHYAGRVSRMAGSEIRELLKLLDQPDIISFAGGIPDPTLFPLNEIAAAHAAILADPARGGAALQYSVSEGYLPLREWLVDYMATLGVPCTPDNIVITNGSQQALDFLGKLFIGPGDKVLVSRPTYLGALQAFNPYEPTYDVLPGPDNNRTVESFGVAGGASGPRLGYVMPEFRNPTGTSLTLAERHELLAVADALDLPLIEDSAYEKLRYDGEAVPSLLALEAARTGGVDHGRVIYCGTFSKTIVPALRVGWIVGPRSVIRKLVLTKQASDLHSSTLNQMVMHEVASRTLMAQVGNIRASYKARRDAMLSALERYMPDGVTWTRPEGGMFIWVTLPDGFDSGVLLRQAITEARVAFVPGRAFFADGSGQNTLRLSFSLAAPDKGTEGIRRLGTLLCRLIEEVQPVAAAARA
ncbi:MAG: PLP-dependent aminotransferase family protein [Azospirillaceae bacterium]|nr:PLP-dependent aminotransferase family protein [Azospirillaceae bacterium]